MTDATETNSSTALAVPKFTAAQIEEDCPARLQGLAKELTEGLETLYKQKTLVGDQETAVKKLIAEVKALCDDGGFIAFREMFFPNLGKSRVYELLAIGTNKKSVEQTKADTRVRVAKHRAKKAAASVSVTVTETSEPKPGPQGAPKEVGAVQVTSTAVEQTPEPTKPRTRDYRALNNFSLAVRELDRVTSDKNAELFSEADVGADDLARLGKFLTDVANHKMSGASVSVLPAIATFSTKQSAEDVRTDADLDGRLAPLMPEHVDD